MSHNDFVHLHVHTEYSLLDGLSRINKLVERAVELGMDSLAITDHGTMFGVIDFFRACTDAGIKPIIGVEAYLTRRERTMYDRDSQLDRKPHHMLLLAKNQTGYQNLLRIASAGQLEGYYYRPRVDHEFLAQHAEGIIATSGCLASEIPSMVEEGREQAALDAIGWYQDVFGKENFFLELQQHDIPQLEVLNRWLIENKQYADVPLVATNDVHYVLPDDHDPHDTLLCIQTSALKSDANRMRMTDPSYHLTTQQEMWNFFGKEAPEALSNTRLIAEMCAVDLNTQGYHLPVFPVPEGYDAETYLRYLCEMGLRWRYGENAGDDPVLRERLDRELGIIHDMGFDTYFLIVWDLCEYARHADIWWNVRGSGAGSLAAFCLGITSIDPIRNNLLFERFLNPGRVSMPDIDLDYPDDRRGEMIDYTARKYGEDKVAAIITFGTMGAKAAVRDVGRVLDVPLQLVNQAAGLIPTEPKPKPLMTYVENNPELLDLYKTNQEIQRVIDTAKELQGVSRHASTHAAGVIVGDKPLVEYLPLHRLTRGDDDNSSIKAVTQFPMETCESIGLLKVDFLGLSTLTILRKACDIIEQQHGIAYNMENIPYRHEYVADDPDLTQMLDETFAMMGRGETVGVFQVESGGMQQMLRGMRPKQFENIIAGISLYRPGPMEFIPQYNRRLHNEEETQFLHPKLEPIVGETYGILVYQEQIMQVAGELFGYELGEADLMRRAVSKKKQKELIKHKSIFIERGPANGIDAETAEKIFDEIEFFANYGFNKCVVGETEIIDADTGRLVQIGDLYAGRQHITHTLTCDTDTLRLQPGRITDVMFNGVKPVYRLRTATGREITATANHPLYTFDGWRLLGELQPGDQIAVPRVGIADFVRNPINRQEVLTPALRATPLPQGAGKEAHLLTGDKDRTHDDTDNDILWDRVAEIEYAGEQPTYDLTIEDTHNFIANDILVHNSHASDYAVITVQTAFLKCHYPAEYMAALLSVHYDDSTKVGVFLEECRRLEIPILPPDVNYSMLDFDIQESDDGRRGIRFGLAAIKNAGVAALQHLIEIREADGPFASLDEFCQRVDLRTVGKRTVESLIMVGAMRAFGKRSQLMAALDRMMSYSTSYHKDLEVGQMNMFGGDEGLVEEMLGNLPNLQEVSQREMLDWEKELLGLYVTGRPADKYRDILEKANTRNIRELKENAFGLHEKPVAVAGEIATLRKILTRNNDMMGVLTLEDWRESAGTIEVVLFPRTWQKYQEMMVEGEIVRIAGKFDTSRGEAQIIAEEVTQNFQVVAADNSQQAAFAPPYSEEEPPWYAEDDYPPLDDGYETLPPEAYAGHPADMGTTSTPPAPPPTPEPASSLPAAAQPSPLHDAPGDFDPGPPPVGNGYGNGHSNGYPQTSEKPRHIMVYLHRSGDAEKDQLRLKKIYNLLQSYPGQDRFSIIVQVQGRSVQMDFPGETHDCEKLRHELQAINGVRVHVVDLAH